MDPVATNSYVRTTEASRTSHTSSTGNTSFSMGGNLLGRDEGFVPTHRRSTGAEPEQAFHERTHKYPLNELSAIWDGLFQGDVSDDLRNNADVYRVFRKDLRSLAGVMMHSFQLVIETDCRPLGAAGLSSKDVQELQFCISELRRESQGMTNANRLARENTKLRKEVERIMHSNHLLQAQAHEAQEAVMRIEEDVQMAESAAEEAKSLALAEARRAAASADSEANVRRLNDDLQRKLVEADAEVMALTGMVRTLQAELAEKSAEQLRAKKGGLSEVGASEQYSGNRDTCWTAAVPAANSSSQPLCLHGLDHEVGSSGGGDPAAAKALGGSAGRNCGDLMGLANDLVRGSQLELRLQEMLPEVRRDVQQWLAQLIRKLKEDNDQQLAYELAKLREMPAGDAVSTSVPAGALETSLAMPRRISSDSWHSDDDSNGAAQTAVGVLAGSHLPEHGVAEELNEAKEEISRLTEKVEEAEGSFRALELQVRESKEAWAAAKILSDEACAALELELCRKTQIAEMAEARANAQVALTAQAQAHAGEAQEALKQAIKGRDALAAELREATASANDHTRIAADLMEARKHITSLESQLAASNAALTDLEARLKDAEQREAREREARSVTVKELETARQRLVRLQSDLRESRADGKLARGEAIAAMRDAKAANSGLLKAQREMEEAVQRLRRIQSEHDALTAALAAAQAASEPGAAALDPNTDQVDSVPSRSEQQLPEGCEDGSPEAEKSVVREAANVSALILELEVVQKQLEALKAQLAAEQRISKQVSRLGDEVKMREADLAAVRAELVFAEAASRERVATLEARLLKADAEAEAARQQHTAEVLQLRDSLQKAEQRAGELEVLQRKAEQDMAIAVASASAGVHERLQQLTSQLLAAEEGLQRAEHKHTKEVEALRAQLAEAEKANIVALERAATLGAEPSKGSSAASSDADIAGEVSLRRMGGHTRTDAQRRVLDEAIVEEEQLDEGDEDNLEVLRARCRALRGKLGLVRSTLASVTETWEAAAQGRLGEKLAEAQGAAAKGHVKSDDEFWARNSEVHALYTLVNALRTSSLYAGAPGSLASYGDNRADGAGSLAAANTGQLAASYRRRRHYQYMETLSQMGELLSGAAETLLRRAVAAPPLQPSHQCPSSGARTVDHPQAADGSSADARKLHGRFTGHIHSRNGSGAAGTALAAAREANCCGPPGAVGGAGAGADPTSPLRSGLSSITPRGVLTEANTVQFAGDPGTIEPSKGAGAGAGHVNSMGLSAGTVGAHPPQPVPSSSFTSDTGSSLVDDDLTNISLLYEIPPMGSPPKYDLSDWSWK